MLASVPIVRMRVPVPVPASSAETALALGYAAGRAAVRAPLLAIVPERRNV